MATYTRVFYTFEPPADLLVTAHPEDVSLHGAEFCVRLMPAHIPAVEKLLAALKDVQDQVNAKAALAALTARLRNGAAA